MLSRVRASAVAALLIVGGLLGLDAPAFAGDTPALVFDQSVTARTDHPVVVVRSQPSGQALGDLGYLDQARSYGSATAVSGPPSFDGPLWIPIEYSGKTGYVNAADVVVGDALPAAEASPTPFPATSAPAKAVAGKAAAGLTTQSSSPAVPAPLLWLAITLGLLSAAAAAFSFITKRSRLQLVAPLLAAATAIAAAFLVPAGSTPLLLSVFVSAFAAAAILRAAVRRVNEMVSADLVKRAVTGRRIQYVLVGSVGLPVAVLFAASAPITAVVAVTGVCASLATAWALISAGPAPEPEFIAEHEEYTPRAWSVNKESTHG